MRYIDIYKLGFKSLNVRKTQISGTVNTYKNIVDKLMHSAYGNKDLAILDYGSGLGYGTKYLNDNTPYYIASFEPYYNNKTGVYGPTFITADQRLTDSRYDIIISNCVLNVVPDDIRDTILKRMYLMLNSGGRIFINVQSIHAIRKTMVRGQVLSDTEVLTTRGTYQKGFTNKSLYDYVQNTLPDNAIVMTGDKFSNINVIVSKI